jgi:hypothetical protein
VSYPSSTLETLPTDKGSLQMVPLEPFGLWGIMTAWVRTQERGGGEAGKSPHPWAVPV